MNRWIRHALFGSFSLILVLLNFGTIRHLIAFSLSRGHEETSQVLLVPFVASALIWLDRKNIFSSVQYSVFPGAVLTAIALVPWFMARNTGMQLNENDQISLLTLSAIVSWLGVFLLSYGIRAFRAALFPLLFLFFTVPLPSVLLRGFTRLLQAGSTEAVAMLFRLTPAPVYREGFSFNLPGIAIEVAPECSGIRSTIALLIAGVLAGHVFLRSHWNKVFLLLAIVPVSIFKNAVRIVTLSLLAAYYDRRILTSVLHTEGGIPFLIVGLFLIYPVLAILLRIEKNKKAAAERVSAAIIDRIGPRPRPTY